MLMNINELGQRGEDTTALCQAFISIFQKELNIGGWSLFSER